MEEEQKALQAFVSMHAKKASIKKYRCAHLTEYKKTGIPLNVALEEFSIENVQNTFDCDNKLVQWTLNQLTTYDYDKEIVIGLMFPNNTLLTYVVRLFPDV